MNVINPILFCVTERYMPTIDIKLERFYTKTEMLEIKQLEIKLSSEGNMEEKYNRRESWEHEHGGAPVKCILDVSKNIRYFFDLAMSESGLTSIQSRILGHLRHAEEEGRYVFQRDIEDVFRIKRSSVTSVLQTLEKKDLITRESVPGDARIKKLVLTEKARKMQVCTYHAIGKMEQEMKALFTEEEFCDFLDYMTRIDKKAMELYDSKEEEND